jgi:hypothetical protein
MKSISVEVSKNKLVLIGIVFICILFVLNRYRLWSQYDKVEGMYIDWTDLSNKNVNITHLLPYFNNDTAKIYYQLTLMHSPYNFVYYDIDNKLMFKELDYNLHKYSGDRITVLVNKHDRNSFKIFSFLSFWLPYIIVTAFFCGVWALIIRVFYENTDSFLFSFKNNKKK